MRLRMSNCHVLVPLLPAVSTSRHSSTTSPSRQPELCCEISFRTSSRFSSASQYWFSR